MKLGELSGWGTLGYVDTFIWSLKISFSLKPTNKATNKKGTSSFLSSVLALGIH